MASSLLRQLFLEYVYMGGGGGGRVGRGKVCVHHKEKSSCSHVQMLVSFPTTPLSPQT